MPKLVNATNVLCKKYYMTMLFVQECGYTEYCPGCNLTQLTTTVTTVGTAHAFFIQQLYKQEINIK